MEKLQKGFMRITISRKHKIIWGGVASTKLIIALFKALYNPKAEAIYKALKKNL